MTENTSQDCLTQNLVKDYQQVRLWSPSFIVLLLSGTMTSIGFNIVSPTLAKYAVGLGASLATAGILTGLFSITALIFRPISGVVADRLNKKRLLIISTIIIGLAAIGYAVSLSLVLLFIFRIIHGTAFAISGTVNAALLAETLPRSRLGEGIGYYGFGHIVATAFGPGIGMAIGEQYNYPVAYLASALLVLGASLLMTRIKYQKKEILTAKTRIKFSDLFSFKILPLALIGGIFSLLNGIVGSFIVLMSDQRGISGISIMFTVSAVVLFLVRLFVGRISDRKELSYILYPALIISAISAVMFGSATSLWIIIIAAVLRAAAQGAAQPSLQTACLRALPFNKSGVATSTFYVGADIGQGIGPIIGGAVLTVWGYDTLYYACAALFIIALLYWRKCSKRQFQPRSEHI
ncbi:MAG: MFS transporter [Saccharofermentanales bacterium]